MHNHANSAGGIHSVLVTSTSLHRVSTRTNGLDVLTERSVDSLDHVQASNTQHLRASVFTFTTPVAVHDLRVLSQQVVRSRVQEREAVILRNGLLIQLLSSGEQSSHQLLSGQVSQHTTICHLAPTSFSRNRGWFTSSFHCQLQDVLVVGISQSAPKLLRVRTPHVIVVHRFVNVGDECVSDQQVINGDDSLVCRKVETSNLLAWKMVLSVDLTQNRELCGLAVLDVANHVLVFSHTVLFESSQNFTSKDLHEQGLGITSGVDLTNTGNGSVSHLCLPQENLKD